MEAPREFRNENGDSFYGKVLEVGDIIQEGDLCLCPDGTIIPCACLGQTIIDTRESEWEYELPKIVRPIICQETVGKLSHLGAPNMRGII